MLDAEIEASVNNLCSCAGKLYRWLLFQAPAGKRQDLYLEKFVETVQPGRRRNYNIDYAREALDKLFDLGVVVRMGGSGYIFTVVAHNGRTLPDTVNLSPKPQENGTKTPSNPDSAYSTELLNVLPEAYVLCLAADRKTSDFHKISLEIPPSNPDDSVPYSLTEISDLTGKLPVENEQGRIGTPSTEISETGDPKISEPQLPRSTPDGSAAALLPEIEAALGGPLNPELRNLILQHSATHVRNALSAYYEQKESILKPFAWFRTAIIRGYTANHAKRNAKNKRQLANGQLTSSPPAESPPVENQAADSKATDSPVPAPHPAPEPTPEPAPAPPLASYGYVPPPPPDVPIPEGFFAWLDLAQQVGFATGSIRDRGQLFVMHDDGKTPKQTPAEEMMDLWPLAALQHILQEREASIAEPAIQQPLGDRPQQSPPTGGGGAIASPPPVPTAEPPDPRLFPAIPPRPDPKPTLKPNTNPNPPPKPKSLPSHLLSNCMDPERRAAALARLRMKFARPATHSAALTECEIWGFKIGPDGPEDPEDVDF